MSVISLPDNETNPNQKLGVDDPLQDVIQNKNLVFQLSLIAGMLKLAKMPGGMRTIQVLGKAVIDGLFETTDSLGQASAANYIAAWANPVLISGIFERFGLLPPRFNEGYHDGISKLTGIQAASSIIDVLFGKDGAFPSTLTFAKGIGGRGTGQLLNPPK